jgi:hypothetical protein
MWISLVLGGKAGKKYAVSNTTLLGVEFPVIFPTLGLTVVMPLRD